MIQLAASLTHDDVDTIGAIIFVALLLFAVWLSVHRNIPGAAVAIVVALLLLLLL